MSDVAEFLRLQRAGVSSSTAATLVHEQVLRRQRHGRRPAPREHGSERGFRQHRTDGTRACPPCLGAHSLHVQSSAAA